MGFVLYSIPLVLAPVGAASRGWQCYQADTNRRQELDCAKFVTSFLTVVFVFSSFIGLLVRYAKMSPLSPAESKAKGSSNDYVELDEASWYALTSFAKVLVLRYSLR